MLLTLMRCLDVGVQWVDKKGREDPEENPSREGETEASKTWSPGRRQCMCLSQRVSFPSQKKRKGADDASQMGVLTHPFAVSHLPLSHCQATPTSR